jgi:histidinol phosphatase-like enzyme/predicted kinase
MKTKTLYLVCGCPGDAKSTLAQMIADALGTRAIVAADDMPGLYVDGLYQIHLQKSAHDWCRNEVIEWMRYGAMNIIVHNTFIRQMYREPYLALAKEYGYAVHVITSEGVVFPDGRRTSSIHNVPEEVLSAMRQSWEPFNPVEKKGMTFFDLAETMSHLEYPNAIIFDMDGTIKQTPGGRIFPSTPNDFDYTEEFKDWVELANRKCRDGKLPWLYVASNQKGIVGGQKTEEFLEAEARLLSESAEKQFGIKFQKMLFAPGRDEELLQLEKGEWSHQKAFAKSAKPGTGMLWNIAPDVTAEVHSMIYWIVGDAHTDERSSDWEFAQACKKLDWVSDFNVIVQYIPVEMLNDCWAKLFG